MQLNWVDRSSKACLSLQRSEEWRDLWEQTDKARSCNFADKRESSEGWGWGVARDWGLPRGNRQLPGSCVSLGYNLQDVILAEVNPILGPGPWDLSSR